MGRGDVRVCYPAGACRKIGKTAGFVHHPTIPERIEKASVRMRVHRFLHPQLIAAERVTGAIEGTLCQAGACAIMVAIYG